MHKLYGRHDEMALLKEVMRQAYDDYSRMVVLTGRKRVGKTCLVHRLMQDTQGDAPLLYFFVDRRAEALSVRDFCGEVRAKLGESVPDDIVSFRGLFQLLMETGKRRRFTLAVDEFQEFGHVNSGVFSDVQELWDRYRNDTNVCLIFSGSVLPEMEKIFKGGDQPLYGRSDRTIMLRPFSAGTLREILSDYKPDYTNEDLLALWTITGGVAGYVEPLMDNGCTDKGKMLHYVCSDMDNFFVGEGKRILTPQFGKRYGTYFSILEQIAHGDVTQSELEASLKINSLGRQLNLLEEKYDIIRKKRPIGAKPGSRTVRYEIKDNFFRFWFRYIHRYSSLIGIQNMSELERIMNADYTTFSGIALEEWFRQKMIGSCRYRQIGSWWQMGGINSKGNRDDFEIEIVAETLEGEVEAIEVKRNPQKYDPVRLRDKVEHMQRHFFRGREIKLIGLSLEDM